MVNRLVSVDDSFNLPDAVNVTDGNLPPRLQSGGVMTEDPTDPGFYVIGA